MKVERDNADGVYEISVVTENGEELGDVGERDFQLQNRGLREWRKRMACMKLERENVEWEVYIKYGNYVREKSEKGERKIKNSVYSGLRVGGNQN